MDRHLRNAIKQFGLQDAIDFKRVAVTLAQLERFNLPPLPSNQETLDKIRKEPGQSNSRKNTEANCMQ